jgi:hypothetical protein
MIILPRNNRPILSATDEQLREMAHKAIEDKRDWFVKRLPSAYPPHFPFCLMSRAELERMQDQGNTWPH